MRIYTGAPLPFGCDCDPYDCGPASHDDDCPARIAEFDWINRNRPALGLVDELLREAERQQDRYGSFVSDVGGMRLAAAALEDEAAEVKQAWRAERKADGWTAMAEEAMQVAAVALRLVIASRLGADGLRLPDTEQER